MRTSSRTIRVLVVVGALSMVAASCGDDDDSPFSGAGDAIDQSEELAGDVNDQTEELEEFAEEMLDIVGAGGGGTLIVDGEEIPIDSAVCQLADDTFDVGTVSDSGWRVFASRGNPANDASSQVLDPDFVQWFPRDVQGDEVVRDGSTFTSGPYTYFNNQDDATVEISYTIECP